MRLRGLPELKNPVLDANSVMVVQGVKSESLYVAEPVEVDGLEFVMEDPDNFFLGEAYKTEGDAHDFWGDLTSNVILFTRPLPTAGLQQ